MKYSLLNGLVFAFLHYSNIDGRLEYYGINIVRVISNCKPQFLWIII